MDGNKASQLAVPGEPWRTGAILSQLEASLRPSSCLILFAVRPALPRNLPEQASERL
jgi:hypothetical protein